MRQFKTIKESDGKKTKCATCGKDVFLYKAHRYIDGKYYHVFCYRYWPAKK